MKEQRILLPEQAHYRSAHTSFATIAVKLKRMNTFSVIVQHALQLKPKA